MCQFLPILAKPLQFCPILPGISIIYSFGFMFFRPYRPILLSILIILFTQYSVIVTKFKESNPLLYTCTNSQLRALTIENKATAHPLFDNGSGISNPSIIPANRFYRNWIQSFTFATTFSNSLTTRQITFAFLKEP